MTGLGVYMGMQACAADVWGTDSLRGRTVAMQGFGKVATHTAEHLLENDARVVVTDVSEAALDRARRMGVKVVGPDDIYDVDCDIFSPCALGGVINSNTIDRLHCSIVAGGANNQLMTAEDGDELHRRGIVYAPDFLINAGGIINAAAEIGQPYNPDRSRQQTERIYEQMSAVLTTSRKQEISTARAADMLAEARLAEVRRMRMIWRG